MRLLTSTQSPCNSLDYKDFFIDLCVKSSHNKSMKNYDVIFREQSRKDVNGERKVWTSKNYYLSYYEKKKNKWAHIWVNTGTTDYDEACNFAKKKMAEIEKGTVYEFIKQEKWFDPVNNPLYYNSRKGNITYTKVNYAHSSKNARYLQVVLEQLKDPIGDIYFEKVTASDAQEFKERLSKYKSYIDAHGVLREITTTFKLGTFTAFSVIWTYYIKTGKSNIKFNPFAYVGTFKKPDTITKKYIFTPEDYRDLFNRELYKGITPSSYYKSNHGVLKPLTREKWNEITQGMWCDFFELIFLTGLRGSEAAALRVNSFPEEYEGYVLDVNWAIKSGLRKENINNETKDVQVFGNPKTGTKRRMVLCDRAHTIVMKYMEGKKGDDLLFTLPMKKKNNRYSTLLTSQQRANAFRLFINEMNQYLNFVDESKLDTLCLHGARTSLNTNLLGLHQHDEWLIAYCLGWKSDSLTRTQEKHYTEYPISSLIEIAKTINKLYLGKEFTWTPKPQEVKKLSRQEQIQVLLAKAAKNKWVENFTRTLERFVETTPAASRVPEIEKFLEMPVEKAQRLKHFYYANLIYSILALNLRSSRANLEELLGNYDMSWDKN